MILRLASSGDDRARAIRNYILPLLREYGALEVQRDTIRLIELRIGAWIFRHWTPFNDLAPGEASSPGYRQQLSGSTRSRTCHTGSTCITTGDRC